MRSWYCASMPDAVVPYAESPPIPFECGADVYARSGFAVELDGIADEILEDLCQLGGVRIDFRKVVVADNRAGFLDKRLEIDQGGPKHRMAVHRIEAAAPGRNARVRKQVVDEPLHADGTVYGIIDKFPGLIVQLILIALAPAIACSWKPCAAAPASRARRHRRTVRVPGCCA